MLSYRHEYHAGNHADVLKHLIQIAVLDYLVTKDKPLVYIDTHAGAGSYKLTGHMANKTKEHLAGIGRLTASAHPLLERHAEFYDQQRYSGSLQIAQQILRPTDAIRCYELHTTDFSRLTTDTSYDRRVKCYNSDGFQGLVSQMPPTTKRAAVLIDPSYEVTSDYFNVIQALEQSLKRFATGVYMVWYPLLEKREVAQFQRKLRALKAGKETLSTLDAQLQIRTRSPGMYGSGMFIINPPWQLATQMKELLPLLTAQLGDAGAQFELLETQ